MQKPNGFLPSFLLIVAFAALFLPAIRIGGRDLAWFALPAFSIFGWVPLLVPAILSTLRLAPVSERVERLSFSLLFAAKTCCLTFHTQNRFYTRSQTAG